jgi:cell division FtsZ-interacting protein ZapD
LTDSLHHFGGRPGTHLQDIEWLQLVKQKMLVAGGASESESAYLRWWLDHSVEARRDELRLWLAPLDIIFKANELLLRFLRQTVAKERVQSNNGQYHRSLSTYSEVMLVRVVLPVPDVIPEFSANKIKLGISFHQMLQHKRMPMLESVPFELHFCTLTQS